MPNRIEKVFDEPKVREVILLAGEKSVKLQIEYELINLAALMSVGGNLNKAQVPFIAEQLIMLYPNESIADFKLCFQRGAIGLYGDIQRLDGVTIGQWMKAYLDEKYEVLESQLMKEKDGHYKPDTSSPGYDPKKHDEWLKKLKEAVGVGNKIPDLNECDVKKYGKEKPVKVSHTAGYAYFNVRGVQIFASTQQHAEEIVEVALKNGLLEEDI